MLTTLAIAWGLPCAIIASVGTPWGFFGWNPVVTEAERFWSDPGPPFPRAGFYYVKHHALLDFVTTVRADYWDQVRKRDRSHPIAPPSWPATVSTDGREGYAMVTTVATGWPLRCFRGEFWMRWCLAMPPPSARIFVASPYMARDLWPVPMLGQLCLGVPHEPLWAGLVLNATLFTALWLPAPFALSGLRRHLRLRRNHCPHCNYDLRATPPASPCPECGRVSALRIARSVARRTSI